MEAGIAKTNAFAALTSHKYADAVTYLSSAIDLSDDSIKHILYCKRSYAQLCPGEHQLALADARKAVELKPDYVKGRIQLGDVCLVLGLFQEAINVYQVGLTLDDCFKDKLGMAITLQGEAAHTNVLPVKKKTLEAINTASFRAVLVPFLKGIFNRPELISVLREDPATRDYLNQADFLIELLELERDVRNFNRYLDHDPRIVITVAKLLGMDDVCYEPVEDSEPEEEHEDELDPATIASYTKMLDLAAKRAAIYGEINKLEISSRISPKKPGLIALFDVGGTLTAGRKAATPKMLEFMQNLRKVVTIGIVGGSDLVKISELLGKTVIDDYDYVFTENGLVAHIEGKLIGTEEFINFTLDYIAKLDIPVKRGTFIEFRSGMLNVSPIGRNCSQEERDEFEKYDEMHNIRPTMISVLRENFAHLNLTFSIGGQISFDVFPKGRDKTFCLKYLSDFSEIHFFGDKTCKGENNFEIYNSERTIGHAVTSPEDTMNQCTALFLNK